MERPGSQCGQYLTVIEKVCNKTTHVGIGTKKDSSEDLKELRCATGRILKTVTSRKSERNLKESFIKQNGFTILMMALREGITDKQTVENIVFILLALLSKRYAGKNAPGLVSSGGSNLLLQVLVAESKESTPRIDFMIQIHQLLAKVGSKDSKFPIKGRLSQALSVTTAMVKSCTRDFKKLLPLLQVLKMYSTNSVNATILVKQNCVQLMFRIISLCGKSHCTVLKLALEILCNLTKSNMQPSLESDSWEKAETLDKGVTLQCFNEEKDDAMEDLKEETSKESSKPAPRCEKELKLTYEKFFMELQDTEISSKSSDRLSPSPTGNRLSPESPSKGLKKTSSFTEKLDQLPLCMPMLAASELEADTPRIQREPSSPQLKGSNRLITSLSEKGSMKEKRGYQCESSEANLSNLLNITSLSTLLADENESSVDISIPSEFPGLRDTMIHNRDVYLKLARKTKSILRFQKVAYPDYIGAKSLPQVEPLHMEKGIVSRENLLDDIDRHLHPELIINEPVYDIDALLSQHVDAGWPTCGQDLSNCDEKIIHSMDKNKKEGPLKFCSRFESGNLRKAIQIREHEYDLLLDSDINTNSHHQWFYFEVSNMSADIEYKFNIINCEKLNSQFNAGMKPVMFSVQEAMLGRPFWFRTGSNICYYKNCYTRTRTKSYFTASFKITFPHSEDICYVAYHFPYTYSTLMTHIKTWEEDIDTSEVLYKHQTLCETLSGNAVPLITITAAKTDNQSTQTSTLLQDKKYVFLSARVHPGESNSSWVLKGIIDFLMSNKTAAQELRAKYIFKIIPMLNPDGVINGNHRCSLSGNDLNRRWLTPCAKLHPTIFHTKGLLLFTKLINKVPILYCDLHGHSQKKNIFIYGCSSLHSWKVSDSENPTYREDGEDTSYKILPYILDRVAPAFSLQDTKFQVEKTKEGTARVIVWREVGVVNSYCMESTYCGFDQGIYKNSHVSTHHLHEMGHRFCESVLQITRPNIEVEMRNNCMDSSSFSLSEETSANVSRFDLSNESGCTLSQDEGLHFEGLRGYLLGENCDAEEEEEEDGYADEIYASSGDEENAQQAMAVGWCDGNACKSSHNARDYDNEVDF